MRTVVQLVAAVLCIAIMAGFMYGLRKVVFTMGPDFAMGAAFGALLLFGLQWALWRLAGEVVFGPNKQDANLR